MTPHATFEQDRLNKEVNNFFYEIEEEKKRKEEEKRQVEIKAQELSEFKKQYVIEYYIDKNKILSKNATSCELGVLYYDVSNENITLYFVEKFLNFNLHEALEGGFILSIKIKDKLVIEKFKTLLENQVFVNEILIVFSKMNHYCSGVSDLLVGTSFKMFLWSPHEDLKVLKENLINRFKNSEVKSIADFFSCSENSILEVNTTHLSHIKIPKYNSMDKTYLKSVYCHEEEFDNIFGKLSEQKTKNLICSRGYNSINPDLEKMFKKESPKSKMPAWLIGLFGALLTWIILIGILAFICYVLKVNNEYIIGLLFWFLYIYISPIIKHLLIAHHGKSIENKEEKPKASTPEVSNRSSSYQSATCQEFPLRGRLDNKRINEMYDELYAKNEKQSDVSIGLEKIDKETTEQLKNAIGITLAVITAITLSFAMNIIKIT